MSVFDTASLPYKIIEPGKPHPAQNRDPDAGQKSPLVTCVMITRGVVPILRHSAECFRRQSYTNRELVVVCYQNADRVEDFFRSHNYNKARLVRLESRLSLGDMRNIGISHSSGEIIAQWDDDDLHDPDRLKHSVGVLLHCERAAATFLSRCLIWWPARKLIFISPRSAWENSMVAWRRTLPVYPALERSEDRFVAFRLHDVHTLTLIKFPSLYIYTVHGRNSWGEEHFESFLARAETVFRDDEYDRTLEHLQRRVPIHDYGEDIRLVEGDSEQLLER
jgi:glycosyltransferase involved in cell wall biosynthesis